MIKYCNLEVEMPCVLDFMDYHEIDNFANDLNKIFKDHINCEELGFAHGRYYGIFYIKRDEKSQLNTYV